MKNWTYEIAFGLLMMFVLGTGAGPALANLVTNGSFEDPVLDPGQDRSSTITGWTAPTGATGYVAQGSLYGGAPDGSQLAEVQGNLVQNTGVQLVGGKTYTLTFQTRDASGDFSSTNKAWIGAATTSDTTTAANYLGGAAFPAGTAWTPCTLTVTCSPMYNGLYLLVILGNDFPASYSLFDLVDVEVTPGPPATVFGSVVLNDYKGYPQNVVVKADFRQGGTVVKTARAVLNGNGQFLMGSIPQGTYDVAFKAYAHLQKVLTGVAISGDPTNLGTITLLSGDNDGNNQVNAADLSIVLSNMDQMGDE